MIHKLLHGEETGIFLNLRVQGGANLQQRCAVYKCLVAYYTIGHSALVIEASAFKRQIYCSNYVARMLQMISLCRCQVVHSQHSYSCKKQAA